MHLQQESHPVHIWKKNSWVYKVHFSSNSHSQDSVVGQGNKSIFINEHLTGWIDRYITLWKLNLSCPCKVSEMLFKLFKN